MTAVVDSSVWLEFLGEGPLWRQFHEIMKRPELLVTPTIVLYEVFKKAFREGGEKRAQTAIALIRRTQIVPLSDELAVQASQLSLQHRLAMADAIIYATALAHDAKVLTLDSDFEGLPHATVVKT